MAGGRYQSGVTLITDKADGWEDQPWSQVREWLRKEGHGWPTFRKHKRYDIGAPASFRRGERDALERVHHYFGGDGLSNQIVAGGSLERLDLYGFALHVITRNWVRPGSVVLSCDAEGEGAYVFRPGCPLPGVQVTIKILAEAARDPDLVGPVVIMQGLDLKAVPKEILETVRATGLEPSSVKGLDVDLFGGEILCWI